MGDVLIGEFKNTAKCEHRICPDNTVWAKPKPLLQAERENKSVFTAEMFSLFLLGDMFASKRDILTLLVRYIVASLQCDMI